MVNFISPLESSSDTFNEFLGVGVIGTFMVPVPSFAAPACVGVPVTIVGTDGDDVIIGTPGDDVIVGLEGDDDIRGGDGNDRICGNEGNDFIRGGDADDELFGGNGHDGILGGTGHDIISGGNTSLNSSHRSSGICHMVSMLFLAFPTNLARDNRSRSLSV